VIYDRAGSSYAELQPGMIDWDACLSDVPYFHWSGIAAAVSQGAADTCAEALAAAHRKGMIISSDFNYRTSLWKYGKRPADVMPGLLQYSKVAVADLDSAAVYFGIERPASQASKKALSRGSLLQARLHVLATFRIRSLRSPYLIPKYTAAESRSATATLLYCSSRGITSAGRLPYFQSEVR